MNVRANRLLLLFILFKALLHLQNNEAFQSFPHSWWVVSSSVKRIWTQAELFNSDIVTQGLPLL